MTSEEQEKFDSLVDYGKRMLADLVPYDSPTYYEDLTKMAENYARTEMEEDSYLNWLCELHDDMLAKGEIDH